MNILTVDNSVYDIDSVPDEIDDLRFCVLDVSDPDWIDYYFLPLIFLESFYAPAVCMDIGGKQIQMPMDWSVIISDEDFSDVEIIPLTSLNNRGFKTPVFNPLESRVPESEEIMITNIYQEVKWFFPKLRNGNILVVPLEKGDNPRCALFVKETKKIPNSIDISELV